jgi:hypothetical protein
MRHYILKCSNTNVRAALQKEYDLSNLSASTDQFCQNKQAVNT